jgi:uncharacterized membrane protein YhiD involved in acid resistance
MKWGGDIIGVLFGAGATVAVAVIGGLVKILVKRQTRPVDRATARRTDAERVSIELQSTRDALLAVREFFNERDEERKEQIAELKTDLAEQVRAMADLRNRQDAADARERARLLQMVVHRAWDDGALQLLRLTNPGYPLPPPIDGMG